MPYVREARGDGRRGPVAFAPSPMAGSLKERSDSRSSVGVQSLPVRRSCVPASSKVGGGSGWVDSVKKHQNFALLLTSRRGLAQTRMKTVLYFRNFPRIDPKESESSPRDDPKIRLGSSGDITQHNFCHLCKYFRVTLARVDEGKHGLTTV